MNEPKIEIPLSEKMKSVPGFFGIRLDEEPPFEVLNHEGDKEIRLYDEQILATTPMASNQESDRSLAFLRLAGYIFGNEIPMTIPVITHQDVDGWTMSFVLPKNCQIESVPQPPNQIVLQKIETQIWAAIRYTGNFDRNVMNAKARELEIWVASQSGFQSASKPRWAQYDAPFTIPFLKRNEAQIQVLPLQ